MALIAPAFVAVALVQDQRESLERVRLLEARLAALESRLSVPAQAEPAPGPAQAQAGPEEPRALELSLNTPLWDKDGLFSGGNKALNDGTLTATYQLDSGFQLRAEYRRDRSGQPFLLAAEPGKLKREQGTAAARLIWWIGGKEGAW